MPQVGRLACPTVFAYSARLLAPALVLGRGALQRIDVPAALPQSQVSQVAPFGRWTLRDKTAQRRLARWAP